MMTPGQRWWMSGTFAAARRVEVDRLWDDAPLPSGDFDRPVFTSADWPPHSAEALRLHAAQVNFPATSAEKDSHRAGSKL